MLCAITAAAQVCFVKMMICLNAICVMVQALLNVHHVMVTSIAANALMVKFYANAVLMILNQNNKNQTMNYHFRNEYR